MIVSRMSTVTHNVVISSPVAWSRHVYSYFSQQKSVRRVRQRLSYESTEMADVRRQKIREQVTKKRSAGKQGKYTTCAHEYRQKHQLLRSQWFLKMRDNVRSRLQQAARCTAVARESIRRARRTLTMKLTADCEYWQKVDAAGSKFNQSLTEGLCHACVTTLQTQCTEVWYEAV